MREIKFRGISVVTGEWVYGCLTLKTNSPRIAFYNKAGYWIEVEVIPESIGECAGIKDKNDKDIYEGDMLRISSREGFQAVRYVKDGYFATSEFALFELIKDDGYTYEVVSNIHENPELLEGTEC